MTDKFIAPYLCNAYISDLKMAIMPNEEEVN